MVKVCGKFVGAESADVTGGARAVKFRSIKLGATTNRLERAEERASGTGAARFGGGRRAPRRLDQGRGPLDLVSVAGCRCDPITLQV